MKNLVHAYGFKEDYRHNDRFLLHLLGKLKNNYQMDRKEKDKFIRRVNLGLKLTSLRIEHSYCWENKCSTPQPEDVIDNAHDQLNLICKAIDLSVKLVDNVLSGFNLNYTNEINALLVEVEEIPDKTGFFDIMIRSGLKSHLKSMLKMEKRDGLKND